MSRTKKETREILRARSALRLPSRSLLGVALVTMLSQVMLAQESRLDQILGRPTPRVASPDHSLLIPRPLRDSNVMPSSYLPDPVSPTLEFNAARLQEETPESLPEPSLLPSNETDEGLAESEAPGWTEPGGLSEPIEPTSPLLEPIPDYGDQQRILRVNPLAVQQGAANLAVPNPNQTPRESLGFPFSAVPSHWGRRIPRLSIEFDLPESRHVGLGDPLEGTSWRNRPFHIDALSGAFFAGSLIDGRVDAQNGMLVGTRLGWDFNHYVGAELRLAQVDVGLVGRTDRADIRMYDIVVNYYPWGDARVRPFTTLGFGLSEFRFADDTGLSIQESTLSVPFGGGVKFYASRNLAIRAELIDNLALGSDVISTMNNLSLTGGIEWRFGGSRRNYYPYEASSRIW